MKKYNDFLMIIAVIVLGLLLSAAFRKIDDAGSKNKPAYNSFFSREDLTEEYKEGDSLVRIYRLSFWRQGDANRSTCRLTTTIGNNGEVKSTLMSCK